MGKGVGGLRLDDDMAVSGSAFQRLEFLVFFFGCLPLLGRRTVNRWR